MTEEATAGPPSSAEAKRWIGARVDDAGGAGVGHVHGFFADAESGEPSWLIAKLGHFRGPLVAIPIDDCAGGGGKVWVAHERDAIRRAPVVDPTRPLLREHELTIGAHYGIGPDLGRAAAAGKRAEGAITSRPG